jgi:phthalate 4,5-dioxygenase oxygenase subunit
MGPIVDRTKEHLGASDRAVSAVRRLLLNAVRAFQEGQDPPGLDASVAIGTVIGDDVTSPLSISWREACPLDPGHDLRSQADAIELVEA